MSARTDLDDAIRAVAVETEAVDAEFPIIAEWVLVGRAVGAADDECCYFRMASEGMPTHSAVGLMTYGVDRELHGPPGNDEE